METRKAIDITDALGVLAAAFDSDVTHIAALVCFMDDKRIAVMREAIDESNKFYGSDVVSRGKMLGLDITVSNAP